ncbi:hypothetical protein A2110_02240 [Candidatus Jorgensenbacteria bacterium GWA1_54_12]|uniref:LTD domain-containing protein n=1 Tax=Candidatus Jorgensenbacteria bacterium GWA1_54_12 TaxID=1798468 RepID=A0A1F6BKY6_9BACT|nr:MAG: hypothetical protein A2110_02240 [Candidatus Jorgensenbacteria bacterium GWA1_54_12]
MENRGHLLVCLLFAGIFLSLFVPFRVLAYSFTTHAFLTDVAVDFYNASFPDRAIPDALKDFLADGAMHEESPPRLLNHFYDPMYGRGLVSAYINGYSSKEWAVSAAKQNEPRWKAVAAVTSILSAALKKNIEELTLETDFTWGRAKYFYLTGDVGKAMYLLGHVLHLVQDASVPAATRNDGASLVRPDPYELWTWRFTRLTPDKELATRLGGKQPIILNGLGAYFDGLATYSNNNFYSENTAGLQSGYEMPFSYVRKKEEDIWFRLIRDSEFGTYRLAQEEVSDDVGYVGLGSFSTYDDNHLIAQDYWRILSTKSVQYAAGVIDLFFREAEAERGKALEDTETGGQTLIGRIFAFLKDANRVLSLGVGEKKEQTVVLLDRAADGGGLSVSETNNEADEVEACAFATSASPSRAGLIINEVAWMGSAENYRDEWIELKNILGTPLWVGGYTLIDEGEQIRTALPDATLRPGEILLLRRGVDYEGVLGNENEGLRLFDSVCRLADEVVTKPDWPAGSNETKQTMERAAGFAWQTSIIPGGTPGAVNSAGVTIIEPAVSMSVTTMRRADTVYERGKGFTPGGSATLHFGLPDGNEATVLVYVGSNGTFEKIYVMPINAAFGDYLYYAVDEATGKKSNAVRYRVIEDKPSVNRSSDNIAVSSSLIAVPEAVPLVEDISYTTEVTREKCVYDGGGTPSRNSVIISEVAWMGTLASAQDEWIELKNISGAPFNLAGCELIDEEEQIHVVFGSLTIPAGGYVLLERTDDTSVPSVPADVIYTGSLGNTEEGLRIFSNQCALLDEVVANPAWPGGDSNTRKTMERMGSMEWQTSTAPGGTPRAANSYGVVTSSGGSGGSGGTGGNQTSGNGGTSTSTPPEPEPEPVPTTSTSTRVMISEVMPGAGTGLSDVEWVELYNPSDVTVGIGGWSLRRRMSAGATSSQPLVITLPTSTIPARGFYLIGSPEYALPSSMTTFPSALYSTSYRLAYDDDVVMLVNGENEIVDEVSYESVSPGESVERYAHEASSCYAPTGGYAFKGNGCPDPTLYAQNSPVPQSTTSMREPRAAPAGITPPSFVYDPATLSITGSWSPYIDAEGEGTGVIYSVTEGTSGETWYHSTSLSFSHDVREVGRAYTLSCRALDRDGLSSALSTSTLVAQSFFDELYVYPDTRLGGTAYLFDAYYSAYPFIPGVYNSWKAVIFSLNAPPVTQDIITTSGNWETDDADGTLRITYKQCNDSYGSRRTLILPDAVGRCSVTGGGLQPEGMSLSCLEDNHFIVETTSSTSVLSLGTSDYVAASFYSFQSGSGEQQLKFVAADGRRYYVRNSPPGQEAPTIAAPSVLFDSAGSRVVVSWVQATDADTLDNTLTYEINFSPEIGWENVGTTLAYERIVSPGNNFIIGLRAVDDFGNRSTPVMAAWEYPPATFFLTQTVEDGWSGNWGYTQTDLSHRQVASFQSVTPSNNFSFNRAVVKVKCATVMYGGTSVLRLSVYDADPAGNPDFTSFLGDAVLDAVENSSVVREITFLFQEPVSVSSGEIYWLVLDAAGATSASALYDNRWVHAIMRGGPAYADGRAGRGYSRGLNGSCADTTCSFDGDYRTPAGDSLGPSDWYFKLGLE